ncbi:MULTISPECIES: tetrahydromethanopterin S-methyltransferase subunit A [unclassified Methanoregula]|uniref:tetrahydromethanopterin S-methyltransferase subunit A n=1 Tax=unclassified Methanoregula TaxID=2649730 RepID=UPI0009CFF267|nr:MULTISPECIES: tetrahydromethanopterin S-methyltransferase subunit A [unclassified Methanoregula]OPX62061.1 MAG: Tetrahydromethanopterin S-methyltransferase subunit A 1 [Methanoregula sp. PtaB.Bin085]OPY36562.1 MAG: Tetrahydromethanopterin S-methyltransferase subunit A 1 [Methanoregula sp. PtaU1.Bin006]
MANKKSPASGWPLIKGDFHSGDANSPVAVVTMGSHLDEQGICDAGAALCGSCKTENLGLEKVIANVIANPNIRFLLLCGTEVKGHLSGQTLVALHKGGVKEGRVVGAEGAIPFIENLKDDAIKRFQEQVEVVNIMESEDLNAIKAKINELKGKDPGAIAADAMVVEVKEAAGGGAEVGAASANPQFLEIEKRLDKIEKKIEFVDAEIAQRVGRKIGRDIGILYGLIAGVFVFVILLFLYQKLMGML